MDQLKVMILYGGVSEEHAVSVKSAIELSRNLDAAKYHPLYVFIGRDGRWRLAASPKENPEGGAFVLPSADRNSRGLAVWMEGRFTGQNTILPVDVAWPMLHGRYGEDGTIQGVLEMSGIPYVGCGIAASALCMDKALAYVVAAEAGVRVPHYRVIHENGETAANGLNGLNDLNYPLFVKPARSGSSFGVSKVTESASLPAAIEMARQYDGKVLLEEAVAGSEVGCAVLGNGSDLFVGALDQIELSRGFFRIHQEARPEQGSENAVIRVPAPLSEDMRALVAETAKRLYRALGCRGLARVDLFLTPQGQVVLNEVNTMPGFASYSRYPRMMAEAGVPLREVIDRLIALALEDRCERETLFMKHI